MLYGHKMKLQFKKKIVILKYLQFYTSVIPASCIIYYWLITHDMFPF